MPTIRKLQTTTKKPIGKNYDARLYVSGNELSKSKERAGASIAKDHLPLTHPGEYLLEEFLHPLNISAAQLSDATGLARSRITEITKGRRKMTADTALRLAAFFGTSPEFWLNLQNSYDIKIARRENAGEYQRIHRYEAIAER